jgi:hypothetical protein
LFNLDQSFGSKRDTEIHSVEAVQDIRRDEVAGSSKNNELQNKSYDGVNTKVDVSKYTNGKELRPGYIILC